MVVVNAIREFWGWTEMAVANIEVAQARDVLVIVDPVVSRFTRFELVGAFHLHDVHLVVIAPKAVDGISIHTNANDC